MPIEKVYRKGYKPKKKRGKTFKIRFNRRIGRYVKIRDE